MGSHLAPAERRKVRRELLRHSEVRPLLRRCRGRYVRVGRVGVSFEALALLLAHLEVAHA